MVYKRVGKNIRRQRKLKNMTQKQLAEEVHCSVALIGGIERGTRHVDLVKLDRIATALGCDYMKLLERCDTQRQCFRSKLGS